MHRPSRELVVVELLHVVGVHPGQLLDVEGGRVTRYARQVEDPDQLLAWNDLLIAPWGPA